MVELLPVTNLLADSESGSLDSYSCFLVTILLSRLVSEIFVYDKQTDGKTDNADHYYSWPHIVAGQLKMRSYVLHVLIHRTKEMSSLLK